MNGFMITPIGISVIAVYSFVILIAVLFLSRLMPKFRWKWVLLAPPAALLLTLPWAEEAWISWHFKEACKDAGVKVYRQVEVEGYLDGLSPKKKRSIEIGAYLVPHPVDFEQRGYRYYEEMLIEGGASHHERVGDRLMLSVLEIPKSRYLYKYAYQPTYNSHEEPIGWKLQKLETQVVDIQTGELLGRDITVKRWAPVADALWAQFIGSTLKTCPSPDVSPYVSPPLFPQAVLKPTLKP